MKLSILVPSVHTRRNTFLNKSLNMLYNQLESLPQHQQKEVEILYIIDNKTIMLGDKRNSLVDLASGEYVVFVDDDDRISDNYISSILEATQHNTDCITFLAEVSLNGDIPKICDYSTRHKYDYNTKTQYNRIPNHICAVKRDLVQRIKFPSILYGEDSAYSKLLLPLLKSEHQIKEVLYYYDYNQETTETQMHLRPRKDTVDLIILSNAKNSQLYRMTQNTIDTAIAGALGQSIRVIVIEQTESKYKNAETHRLTTKFNYNGFANYGASLGTGNWIVVANNDLVFYKGWLNELLKANHPIVSPKCPIDPRQRDIKVNTTGFKCGRYFSGWCFMMQRSLYAEIGGFSEEFSFYCADNVVIEQLREVGVTPMLVPGALARHLGSSTLASAENKDELTFEQVHKFNLKYDSNLFEDNNSFKIWKSKNNL